MKVRKATVNLLLDAVIGFSFLVEAVSGFVLWLVLTGGYEGGRNPNYGRIVLFDRDTWLLLHDWFAVVMTVGILIHIVLHWKWITCAVRNAWQQALAKRAPDAAPSDDVECPA